jgi:hypothetical protein
MKTYFVSKYDKYKIAAGDKVIAEFVNFNFQTEDEELVAQLKAYPTFEKDFYASDGIKVQSKNNLVNGVRTSEDQPLLGAEGLIAETKLAAKNELTEKFQLYLSLSKTLLKADGNPRADADPEELAQLDVLKGELGL